METRLAVVVLLLLLLSGAVHCQQELLDFLNVAERDGGASGRKGAHQSRGYKLMTNWLSLKGRVWKGSGEKENEPCNATAEQTYAYFLLGDLIDFHVVDGIIAYGFPRRGFYEDTFKELHRVADLDDNKKKPEPEVVFCEYDTRLVCHEEKCVYCSNLPSNADSTLLKEACDLEGNGGKDAPLHPPKGEGEVGTPETLEKPEKENKRAKCDEGWLKAEDMRKWQKKLGDEADGRRSWRTCPFNFDLNKGFYLLDDVVRKFAGDGELEAELKDYRDFYEERLWMFRGGENTRVSFCQRTKDGGGDGPWVCGMDAQCVRCNWVTNATYSANPPPEMMAGCEVEVRPEGMKKTCGDTSSSTTEESSGVRMGGSGWGLLAAAAAALLALTSLADPVIL